MTADPKGSCGPKKLEQFYLCSYFGQSEQLFDMFIIKSNASIRRLTSNFPSIPRPMDAVILPRQIERMRTQWIAWTRWKIVWPLWIPNFHWGGRTPTWSFHFFDNACVSAFCQFLGFWDAGWVKLIDTFIFWPILHCSGIDVAQDCAVFQIIKVVPPIWGAEGWNIVTHWRWSKWCCGLRSRYPSF